MFRGMSYCAVLTVLMSVPLAADDPGPNSDTPPLKPLHQFVGTWSVELFDGSGNRIGTGQFENAWILGGRYIEQHGKLQVGDEQDTIRLRSLFGYDSANDCYRRWIFLQDGNVITGTGTWSDAAKTFTWKLTNQEDVAESELTVDFSTPGIEAWKLVTSDPPGVTIQGQNRRLANAP